MVRSDTLVKRCTNVVVAIAESTRTSMATSRRGRQRIFSAVGGGAGFREGCGLRGGLRGGLVFRVKSTMGETIGVLALLPIARGRAFGKMGKTVVVVSLGCSLRKESTKKTPEGMRYGSRSR